VRQLLPATHGVAGRPPVAQPKPTSTGAETLTRR